MKSRLSYFLISGIIILSIFTISFIWHTNNLKQIPAFNKNPYIAPISSKYIPINSDIIIHWKINPTLLPKYVEHYQDQVNKHITNNKTRFIRDSSFKLISLDFVNDISNWVGDYGSFALLNTNKQIPNDWIMIMGIKDNVNIEEELASISDSKNLDRNLKSINSLGIPSTEILSKKINSNHSIYFAKNKDNVLISSNPKIIKSAILESNSNTLSTKEKYKYIKIKDNLYDGFILFEMSPSKLLNKIDQKEKVLSLNDVSNLISSVNIDKNKLSLDGILSFNFKSEMPAKSYDYNYIDIMKEYKSAEDLILVDNPNQYFIKEPNHPYKNLVASLIQESTTSDNSNLFRIILEKSKGNLLWLNDKDWLILTSKADTSKKEISDILKHENFSSSILDFKNRELEVWSKISTDENEKYKIKENIEAIIYEDQKNYLWSQNLSSISNFDNTNYLNDYSDSEKNIGQDNDFEDILRIHLGEERTKAFLNNFYPYILFRTMLGNKLTSPRNIDISISVPKINYPDFIKFKINLKTS